MSFAIILSDTVQTNLVSNQYQQAKRQAKKPVFMRVSEGSEIIPIQFPKCILWYLVLHVFYILFLIICILCIILITKKYVAKSVAKNTSLTETNTIGLSVLRAH